MDPVHTDRPSATRALVRLSHVTVAFGGVLAVNDVSLDVPEGQVLGLVGPNGAGKSTLLGAIAGAVPVRTGTIRLGDADVTGVGPLRMSRLGVSRTFQKVRLFHSLSALDNVMVAAQVRERSTAVARRTATEALERAGLGGSRFDTAVANLPLADRKRVEIARSLAARPTLLLLDEMMNGLTPVETEAITGAVKTLPAEGVTVIVVEHVLQVVRALCDRLAVLHHGELIAEGAPDDVLSRPQVVEAWLGRPRGEGSA